VVRRDQIEANHVAHLFDEAWIGGELKTLAAVRLQGEQLKDAMHGGLGKPFASAAKQTLQ